MPGSFFKKADIVLFVLVFAVGIAGWFFLRADAGENATVSISVGGEEMQSLPLYKDGEYEIRNDYGYNIICIENGQVWVKDADCPGGDCMNFGKISKDGQIILCLPHRLAVTIKGKEGSDAVSY